MVNVLCSCDVPDLTNIHDNIFVTYTFVNISIFVFIIFRVLQLQGRGWLNELGSWITKQRIQAYHQYGVGWRPAL